MKIEIEVADKNIVSALCSAFEHGIGYWCRKTKIKTHDFDAYNQACIADWGDAILASYYAPLLDGSFELIDDDGGKRYTLDRAALARGLACMPPGQLAALMGDDADATTGDVLVQCAIFGKIVYA